MRSKAIAAARFGLEFNELCHFNYAFMSSTESPTDDHSKSPLHQSMTLTALGIVLGDIGTSPLYSVREAFHGLHGFPPTAENIFGALSMIFWSLILVISVKYLGFVLRADNKGEGGVLALTALATPFRLRGELRQLRTPLLYLGLFGSALLFGDGMITPAISVLSAVEGLQFATPLFQPYVIPITLLILALLFLSQKYGTARIGLVFGPVLLLWFSVLGILGLSAIVQNPYVLEAIDPRHAFYFFAAHGFKGFFILGAIFLVVTGGEAMYADMGHFGKSPIRRAWFSIALPGLLLNYFGQGALLLANPDAADSPFFKLAPAWALVPLVLLAMMATVIASQALISGVFSLTRQATQLGYAPRFRIVHTSSEEIGQIYIPPINWTLFVLASWLVLEFGSSSRLAAAYGVGVSMTMVITTLLACAVAPRLWKWNRPKAIFVFIFFVSIDLIFLGVNLTKVPDGGWFPLIVGAVVFTLMTTWRRGRQILMERLKERSIPFTKFLEQIAKAPPARVPGTAVFMTGDPEGTPPALLHNVRLNRVLHGMNVLITVITKDEPHIPQENRVEVKPLDQNFYRIIAHYGFMETPDIVDVIKACKRAGLELKLEDLTFFLGRETLLSSERPGMAPWREKLFSLMSKNAERATNYFNIPPSQVMEVGLQIEL